MTLYIDLDFHPHQQTVSFCQTTTGEVRQTSLLHNLEQVRSFYSRFSKAIVGVEASCTAVWFEHMLFELGHELKTRQSNSDSRSCSIWSQIRFGVMLI